MMTKNKLVTRCAMTMMALFVSSALFAQVTVSGIVVDENEEPVIGASILVKGTTSGTVTDFDGNFEMNVADANATLVVSYVGLETQEVALRNRKVVNVKLVANNEVLDEVVVVGYGSMKKSDLSGATVSMKEEDLKNQITTSLDQAFAGKAAGVTAVQTSGAPGSSSSIRVRGQGTVNAGAEPLYVIDGVIVQGSGASASGYGLGSLGNGKVSTISPIATLNPQDIVSMEILKDASATAIYGAQGANGVILITTKHGKEGKAQFSYDGMVAWSQQNTRLGMMNLREYAQFQCDLADQGEIEKNSVSTHYRNPMYLGEGTDWQGAIFQTGFQHQHQISAQGGTEKIHYYLSGSYMSQEGTIIGSKFDRFSVRSNIDAQLTKWLKVGLNATFSTTNEDIKLADGEQGIIFYSLAANPDQPIYDLDGNYFVGRSREGSGASVNPIAEAMLKSNTLKRQKLMGNIFLEIQPVKQFTFRSDFGFDISSAKANSFVPTYDFGYVKQTVNSISQQNNNSTYWQIKNYATYADSKAGHSWSVMVGQEAWLSKWEYLRGASSNLPSNDVQNIALTSDPTTMAVGQGFGATSMVSAFARATYNYGERYYLTYTFRYDGSSNFGPKNRWAPFNSVAASWRFSNEKFFEPIHDAWSNGKLRFGWGQTGNANIGAFAWGAGISSIFAGAGTPYGNTVGYRPSNLSNPYIHWEKQEQFNVGLDLGFVNDKIMLNADYYYKKSNDMLMDMQLPSYMGTAGNASSALAAPKGNYGTILNQGVEISLDINPFRGKKVEWESNIQVSVNRNKLVALDGTANASLVGKGQWDDVVSRTLVGESLYNFYGYEVEGIYQDLEDIMNSPKTLTHPADGNFARGNTVWPGDLKFKDVNGDGVINELDKTNIGSPLPKFTFGWTNTLRFYGVDLTIFLNGSYGNKILNYTKMGSANSNTSISSMKSQWTNQLRDVVATRAQLEPINPNKEYPFVNASGVTINNWYDDVTNVRVKNADAKNPRASVNADPNDNDRISSRYVEDGSYLRIKNIVLGYTLPKKVLKKMHFDNFRIYLNIQNLATFTKYSGYDPEVGASAQDATGLSFGVDYGRYPSPTTYALGLNIAF